MGTVTKFQTPSTVRVLACANSLLAGLPRSPRVTLARPAAGSPHKQPNALIVSLRQTLLPIPAQPREGYGWHR